MRKLLLALLVVALAVSACGDDDDEGTTSDTTSTAASPTTAASTDSTVDVADVAGIKDGKIIVGGVYQDLGFAGLGDGAKARFDRFNEEGGIDGLTIDFVGARDDGGDADRNGSLIRELVEQDGIYAMVPNTSPFMQPASGDYLASKNIPYFGYGYAPVMCTDYAFAFNGCTVPSIVENLNTGSIASLLPLLNKTSGEGLKIALVGGTSPGSDLYVNAFSKVSESLGMEIVYAEAKVPNGGQADMTPFVDEVMSGDPDIVQLITDFPSALAMKAKLLASGFDGIATDNSGYVPGLLEASPQAAAALEGTYAVTTYPTIFEDSPFAKQMQEDLAGIAIKPGTVIGYLQAELFLSLLEEVSPNYATFAETVNKGVEVTPAEGGIPTKWPEFHLEGAPCNSVIGVQNKEFVLSVPFDCYETIPAK